MMAGALAQESSNLEDQQELMSEEDLTRMIMMWL
jgi:hypothetical protein